MRVSLNIYESTSVDSVFAQKFASTVRMLSPGKLLLVPKGEDDEWTVAFIRHKKREILSFSQLKYVVSISNVRQLPIPVEDMESGAEMMLIDSDYEHHSEVEEDFCLQSLLYNGTLYLSLT